MEKIKNYLLILLVALGMATTFTACSDDKKSDDESVAEYSTLLIGSWYCSEAEDSFTFYSDGTFDYTEGPYANASGHWKLYGKSLTLIWDNDGWEVDTPIIVNLTQKKLVLEFPGETLTYVRI